MLKSYIKTAWRSLIARRFYTILNLLGLGLAIGCCILLYTYISYNLSFDTYHKDAKNTFRLVYDLHLDKTEYDKGSSMAMLLAAKHDLPQVVKSAFLISKQSYIVAVGESVKQLFREEKNIAITNADWFKLFAYKQVSGSTLLLNEPNTAVLTRKQAEKYFGHTAAVGQYLYIKGVQIKVVGIIANSPYNTDLKADMYISLLTCEKLDPNFTKDSYTEWGYLSSVNNAYITLHNAGQQQQVEEALNRMAKAHFGEGSKYYTFKLLSLQQQHFDARYGGMVQKSLLVILTIIGVLIIAIANINYINIMVAQQARRSVEIGTRKVLGASSGQLYMQFVTESIITTVTAALLAVVIALLAMPAVNTLLFTDEPIHLISYTQLALFLLVLILCINLFTGIYPALLLRKLNVFNALKNKIWNIQAGKSRKALVVLQNVIAQVLIACTIIIVLQVQFLKNTDKGFSRKFVVTVPVGTASDVQKQRLKESLANVPSIKSVSYCLKSPSSDSQRGATVQFNNRTDWEKWPARFAIGDSAYCRTFGLQLIAGRNMRSNQAIPEFLINEKMAGMLRVNNKQDIIGKSLMAGDAKGIIVGIVKDFNVKSLIEPIEPSVILEDKQLQTNVAVKLSGRQVPAAIEELKIKYNNIFPDQVFTYQFVDDEIAKLYKSEILQQKLIWCAAIVAIGISSLGLLGLISLVTLQRTKEIGIRKVLGASVSQIGLMLSGDFLKMILIAMLLAVPISWWAMHTWLQNFAYRIQIHWWIFALAGSAAVLIALLTVGFQAIKAAIVNPVHSLRSE